jgi:conflict system STAND superfamily ATPase
MNYSNPYVAMTALRDDRLFVGRVSEKTSILSRIYATQPQSVEIIGERRIGKSSLLYALQRALRADGHSDVIHVLIDAQIFAQGDPITFFSEVVGQVSLQRKFAVQFKPSYEGFAQMVQAIEAEAARLILMIDEFDVITGNSSFKLEFFNFLRGQANNHQVAYILSTVRELESLCHSQDVAGSPFFNIFFRLHLGPISVDEATYLIVHPSSEVQLEFTPLRDWIIALAGLFPFYLQLTCSRIVEFFLNNPNTSLDRDLIQRDVARDFGPHFRHTWKHLDGPSRDVLIRLASGIALGEVDKSVVDILISRGYVSHSSRKHRISSELFCEFVLRQSGHLSNNSLIVTVETSAVTSVQLSTGIRREISSNGGMLVSINPAIAATFRSFDSGIEACLSLRELLDAEGVPFKIVAIAYSDAESLAKVRQLCARILDALDSGEVAATAKVVSNLSRALGRKFRKMAAERRDEELPKLFTAIRREVTLQQERMFGIPSPRTNNVWYEYRNSDTVFVFVHGIFSDSAGCWRNEERDVFWPELVRCDPRLNSPALFLGGYYTDIGSGIYDLDNCEHELFSALGRPLVDPALPPVMQWSNIVFICHSTGGIVVRYMLERRYEHFVDKHVGLMLVASPSYGSSLATRLDWLASFYRNRLGQQLQWGSWNLQELDSRFKALLHDRKIPSLVGVEAYENKFIIYRRFLPNITYVVSEESAGRYFGPPVLLRDTDHFSAAKPDGPKHPSHETLVDFYLTEFKDSRSLVGPELDSDLGRVG